MAKQNNNSFVSDNPSFQNIDIPTPPSNPEGIMSYKQDSYNAMALAEYHRDMTSAGNDGFLQTIAQQNYMLNQAKIVSWQRGLQAKFRLISQDDNLEDFEKELLRQRIIEKADDPIYIPKIQPQKEQETFSTSYKARGVGEFISNLQNPIGYMSRDEAIFGSPTSKAQGLVQLFGPNWQQEVPEAVTILEQKFPSPENITQPSGKTAKEVLPNTEQIAEFNRLGGHQTKEGREYARNFLAGKFKKEKEIPPKPAEYPDAQWNEEHQLWTIIKNGKLVGLKETQ